MINTDFGSIMPLMPVLAPLALLQLGLMIFALIHAVKAKSFKVGNKVLWIVLIVLIDIIGPVLYFIIGRGDGDDGGEGE